MKPLQLSLLTGCLLLASLAFAQDPDPADTTRPALAPTEVPTSPAPNPATPPSESAATPANTSQPSAQDAADKPFDWQADVLGPLARFGGVVLVLVLLIWWMGLPNLLKGEFWTDRTVLALIVMFSFCTAALMDVAGGVLSTLKEVTLLVIGFYFGSGKGRDEQRERTALPNPPAPPGTPPADGPATTPA